MLGSKTRHQAGLAAALLAGAAVGLLACQAPAPAAPPEPETHAARPRKPRSVLAEDATPHRLGRGSSQAIAVLTADAGEPSLVIEVVVDGSTPHFIHPSGDEVVSTRELVLPIGRLVRFDVRLGLGWVRDFVAHVEIPEIGVDLRLREGEDHTLWLRADRPARLTAPCVLPGRPATDCLERSTVDFVPEAEHARWLARARHLDLSPAAYGELLFKSRGCSTCHHPGGSQGHGPELVGVLRGTHEYNDGSRVVVDASNAQVFLEKALFVRPRPIRKGYAASMPSYQGQLRPRAVAAMRAYLECDLTPCAGPSRP